MAQGYSRGGNTNTFMKQYNLGDERTQQKPDLTDLVNFKHARLSEKHRMPYNPCDVRKFVQNTYINAGPCVTVKHSGNTYQWLPPWWGKGLRSQVAKGDHSSYVHVTLLLMSRMYSCFACLIKV
jgi:hypothetical protein